jgi:hypothetical protein
MTIGAISIEFPFYKLYLFHTDTHAACTNKQGKSTRTIYNALTLHIYMHAHAVSHHKYMMPTFLSNFLPGRHLLYIFINNKNNNYFY